MTKMTERQALEKIASNFRTIHVDDLTVLERQVLDLACSALEWEWKEVDDEVFLVKS